MTVSGVAILRNVVRLGYPFEASLRSLLPLVDELVVAVGDSDDGTWDAVAAIDDPRIKAFRTVWSPSRRSGEVLSEQTNVALERCSGDWAMYLQADEVLHENDVATVRQSLSRHLTRDTEGLLFRYHHFWSGYGTVADDWVAFYPRAVRAVRLGRAVESAGDACGFVVRRGHSVRGLIKANSGADVFHYGWSNASGRQLERMRNLRVLYTGVNDLVFDAADVFGAQVVRGFAGTHPATMLTTVEASHTDRVGRRTGVPAGVRALAALARRPDRAREWIRPLLPTVATNTWWRVRRAVDRLGDR